MRVYVAELTRPSLQGTGDLKTVRDALGITTTRLSDSRLDQLGSFFSARNEIVHELDFVETAGPGSSSRRSRNMNAVRDQCNEVLQLIAEFIRQTDQNISRLPTKKKRIVSHSG